MIKDCNLKDGKIYTNKRITSILKNHLQNYDIFVLIQIKSQKNCKKEWNFANKAYNTVISVAISTLKTDTKPK